MDKVIYDPSRRCETGPLDRDDLIELNETDQGIPFSPFYKDQAIGNDYFLSAGTRVTFLDSMTSRDFKELGRLDIEPQQKVSILSNESFAFPNDICAELTPYDDYKLFGRFEFFLRTLKPGFHGNLTIILDNQSDQTFRLLPNQKLIRMRLSRVDPASANKTQPKDRAAQIQTVDLVYQVLDGRLRFWSDLLDAFRIIRKLTK